MHLCPEAPGCHRRLRPSQTAEAGLGRDNQPLLNFKASFQSDKDNVSEIHTCTHIHTIIEFLMARIRTRNIILMFTCLKESWGEEKRGKRQVTPVDYCKIQQLLIPTPHPPFFSCIVQSNSYQPHIAKLTPDSLPNMCRALDSITRRKARVWLER